MTSADTTQTVLAADAPARDPGRALPAERP
jgi:hypothetical protein